MTITLSDGTTLKIWFEYYRNTHNGRVLEITRLHCDLNGNSRGYGSTVVCHHNDTPNRPAARRAALTKFLKPLPEYSLDEDRRFSREERKAIWQAYFKQHADLRKR